jgi:hypothetical protein
VAAIAAESVEILMSNNSFGDSGPARRLVVEPSKPGNANDCADEIFAALTRHGYALTLGMYEGRAIIVLSKCHEPGRLEPVAELLRMVPGDRKDPRCGIVMRRCSGIVL